MECNAISAVHVTHHFLKRMVSRGWAWGHLPVGTQHTCRPCMVLEPGGWLLLGVSHMQYPTACTMAAAHPAHSMHGVFHPQPKPPFSPTHAPRLMPAALRWTRASRAALCTPAAPPLCCPAPLPSATPPPRPSCPCLPSAWRRRSSGWASTCVRYTPARWHLGEGGDQEAGMWTRILLIVQYSCGSGGSI